MNYRHVKENGNVVVCLILLLLTFAKSTSACDFTYESVSSFFQTHVNKMIKVLFNDYEVSVISNFEQDKHCIVFWPILETYTILQTLKEKAESDLKELIEKILTDLSILQNCSFLVPKTCIMEKRPLVKVLRDLDSQQVKNINEIYSNCTQIRCVSGNTIAYEPVDHHDNVTAHFSTKGQDTGNNEDYLQQKRQFSNKTTSLEDNEKQTSQTNGKTIAIVLPIFFVFIIGVVLLMLFLRRKQRYEAGRTVDTEAEAEV